METDATSSAREPAVAGSSFYAAMRVLPAEQRQAMFAIYDFCRAVDDVADGRGDRQVRLAELAGWRMDIGALFADAAPSRVRALAGPILAFDLQREDFLSIIDGMEMDVQSDIRAPELSTLDLYCDRVASAVGRLSVRVFGIRGQDGAALAFHLGRALQLTNILRDLDEDAGKGRLYLPREALVAAGIDQTDPATVLDHPALSKACATVLERVRDNFAAAGLLMAKHPLSIVRAPRLMAEVYRNILERLAARGWAPPRRPVRVARPTLLWIVLRHGLLNVSPRGEM
ncbi:MAG TPA: presqualene diphosphate synthase HpnD [Paraburkholderia sp.]|nr:presqualene diphosphate synthase HpnD [Paraburkholderia sp.]